MSGYLEPSILCVPLHMYPKQPAEAGLRSPDLSDSAAFHQQPVQKRSEYYTLISLLLLKTLVPFINGNSLIHDPIDFNLPGIQVGQCVGEVEGLREGSDDGDFITKDFAGRVTRASLV